MEFVIYADLTFGQFFFWSMLSLESSKMKVPFLQPIRFLGAQPKRAQWSSLTVIRKSTTVICLFLLPLRIHHHHHYHHRMSKCVHLIFLLGKPHVSNWSLPMMLHFDSYCINAIKKDNMTHLGLVHFYASRFTIWLQCTMTETVNAIIWLQEMSEFYIQILRRWLPSLSFCAVHCPTLLYWIVIMAISLLEWELCIWSA